MDTQTAMDETDMRKWSRPTKMIFFAMNFIIWMGSCALLALGIYSIVDSPFVRPMVGDSALTTGAVVLIIVGGVTFVISFVGCCGALNNNKCLVMTHVVALVVLLAILLIGLILGLMFSDKAETVAIQEMRKTMEKYDSNTPTQFETTAWNEIQRSLKCCGITNYTDWATVSREFSGSSSQKVPLSCCRNETISSTLNFGCLRGVDARRIYTEGCLLKTSQLMQQHSPAIGSVAAIVAVCMIVSVVLGIVVYKNL